jgi:hypothetical protein
MIKRRRRGRLHGAAMSIWFFFANMFDPIKAARTEQIFTNLRHDPRPERRATGAPSSHGDAL